MSSSRLNQSTREQVLRDIRFSLNKMPQAEKEKIDRRFKFIRQSLTPSPVVDGILLDRFIEKHTAVNGTYDVVSSYSEVPEAVGNYLNQYDLPANIVTGKSDFIARFDWPEDWVMECRTAYKQDVVSVTDAICAIAETGSIVIVSSPEVSSTHLFLPENHIVVFNVGQIVRHLDDALQIGSRQLVEEARGFHIITGPSKTADVEQTIQYGAHGPRRLHAIIIDAD